MYIKIIPICITLHLAYVHSNSTPEGEELVFFTALFRHGDRTPVDPYPNDPYRNRSYWPAAWGELTDRGKLGEFSLGQYLRSRYGIFLPLKYFKEDIYVQSTDVDRTLMSAYSVLAGLYEPNTKDNWNRDIRWQPIPVHTIPEKSDEVLAMKKPCPKYNDDLKALKNSEEFQKINKRNSDLYSYLSKKSGLNVSEVGNVETLFNTLFIEYSNNFTLPKWTKSVFPQPMKAIADFSFSVPCYNQDLARLKVGPLISNIHSHFKKKIEGKLKPNRKAWIYSAHDTTVANILKGLNVFEIHSPPYSSLVLIELKKRENQYFVEIYYKNSTTVPPYWLQIPGCDQSCPFEQFSQIIKPIIPTDWEKECQHNQLRAELYDLSEKNFIGASIFLAAMFLLLLLIILCFYKKQYHAQNEFIYHSLKMEMQS